MSRIGKKPVPVPAGVTAAIDGQIIKVKGSKGELSFTAPDNVVVTMVEGRSRLIRVIQQRAPVRCGGCPARRLPTLLKA